MKSVLTKFSYVLFPRRCDLCGEVTAVNEKRCSECRKAERITGTICHKCGRETANCVCKKEKFSPMYKAFAAPYYFEGSRKRAVYRFKNNGFTELAPAMAEEIVQTITERFADVTFDCVTSVPMTRQKIRRRGYNQSEILAKEVAKLLEIPYEPLIKKCKETRSQRKSSAAVRKVNLYGAFDLLDTAAVEGRTILIVDDVKTTGSTLNECASMMTGNKAKAVYAAAFTVTNKKSAKSPHREK